jgi:hypothetical protein
MAANRPRLWLYGEALTVEVYWLRVSRIAQIRARGAEMAEFLSYRLNRLKDVWSQHRHGRM